MSILRVQKNANYTVMNRTALNDKRLSWKAKGIIAYMLSMPDDWVFYISELVTHATDGEKSFRSGLKELKECGYVERRPVYKNKKIDRWDTIIHEVPVDKNGQTVDTPLLADFVHVGNVHVGNVHVQNDALLNTDIKLNTDTKLNTDNNRASVQKERKETVREYVSMTSTELNKLIEQFGERGAYERIDNLNLYKGSSGKKYKSDYLTILNWERKNNKGGVGFEQPKDDPYANLF